MAARKTYLMRVSPEVWDALNRLAAAELRSVNSQVEMLLREGLAKRGLKLSPPGQTASESSDGHNEEGSD